MNKIMRRKDSDILVARSEDGKLIGIAGHVDELLKHNLLLDYKGSRNGWLIISASAGSEMQKGHLYSTRDEVKEALRAYRPVC